MRSMRDRQLPEPYRSWIDRAQPMPEKVRLVPRAVRVTHDLLFFVFSIAMFLGMGRLVHGLFWQDLAAADARWEPILAVSLLFFLLALIPILSLRRLYLTIGAQRDLKRGTLRQGILVGPEGMLVRMEPNDCYPIALDRFVSARIVHRGGGQRSSHSRFVIDTLDGPVDYFDGRLPDPPKSIETLLRCVAKLRR
jgi:hypothetical protein